MTPGLAVGVVLFLSQFAFYVAIYVFLRSGLGIAAFMLRALPVFAFGVAGPLWALRTAQRLGWSLAPVQLGMFAASVASAFFGLIVIERQMPSIWSWLGLALVLAGVGVSTLHG
ncbi:MAG: hypothetical protein K6U14_07130 [Firmicutes bacterium]|nr:hypothetical protein [Alicyclobacillaceae bacterium]MCL6497391.1 hypothetical protein [Bacillota bacterium]